VKKTEDRVKQFFKFARERYYIFLLKEGGAKPPYTRDKVLQQYRFCNIFREDDVTTRWFAKHVRDKVSKKAYCLEAVAGFRWFNRISTGEIIKDVLVKQGWNSGVIHDRLENVKPLVTGAYMIRSPYGMNKLKGICQSMDGMVAMKIDVAGMNLQEAWTAVKEAPCLGFFTAYEVVTDLRHTDLLNPTDRMTWCAAGPGASRGIGWIVNNDPDFTNYSSPKGQEKLLGPMRELLDYAGDEKYWPADWPAWEMREVEHTLCEYDKWRRGTGGQRLKRKFQ